MPMHNPFQMKCYIIMLLAKFIHRVLTVCEQYRVCKQCLLSQSIFSVWRCGENGSPPINCNGVLCLGCGGGCHRGGEIS